QWVDLAGGTLNLTAPMTDGTGTSYLSVHGGTLNMNNQNLTVDQLLYYGGPLNNMGGVVTVRGLLQLQNATLTIPNIILLGNVALDPTLAGSAVINSNLNLNGGTRTFDIADTSPSGSDLFLRGVLSNGGLVKIGLGTLKLEGVNTYAGA